MSYRKVVVNNSRYLYKIGVSYVEIRDEEFKRVDTIPCWEVKGITESQFKSSRAKVSSYMKHLDRNHDVQEPTAEERDMASVFPSDIRNYIQKNFKQEE